MSIESKTVLDYLATVSEAVDVRTMANALGCTESTSELNNALGGLVRTLKVKRHHNQDGILRYSLYRGPSPVPQPASRPVSTHSTPKSKTVASHVTAGSLQEKMVGLLTTIPTFADSLAERAGLRHRQGPNILQLLKAKGLAQTDSCGRWWRGPAELKIKSKVPRSPQRTVAQPPPEKVGQTKLISGISKRTFNLAVLLDENVRAAEAALQAYVESTVDHSIYAFLNDSVKSAREARAAAEAERRA